MGKTRQPCEPLHAHSWILTKSFITEKSNKRPSSLKKEEEHKMEIVQGTSS